MVVIKKFLSIIMVAVLSLAVLPSSTFAADDYIAQFNLVNANGNVVEQNITTYYLDQGNLQVVFTDATAKQDTLYIIKDGNSTATAYTSVADGKGIFAVSNAAYSLSPDTAEGVYKFYYVIILPGNGYSPVQRRTVWSNKTIEIKQTLPTSPSGGDNGNGNNDGGSGGADGGISPATGGKLTDSSGKTVTVSIAGIPDSAWTGKQVKPVPAVTASGQKLTNGTDYTIAYGANKYIGKGTLMIKGAGKYKGSIAVPFRIVPKAPTGVKLTAATKSLKVKWTKPAKFKNQKITGYEVQYRYQDSSKWTVWKTKSFKVSYKATAKTVTQTLKNLKAKKQYQVQVRACKKVSGTKYVSAWTKVKAKNTK